MILFERTMLRHLLDAATQFPVLAILGPRQSGKTTLVKMAFPHHRYVNLEDLSIRELATNDPRGFLEDFPNELGIILDEVQHVPALFSYVQVLSDEKKRKGFYVLTGSENFALDEGITQSLAGRVAKFTLFPLSIAELRKADALPATIEELTFRGCYPQAYAQDISIERLYRNYIETYVEQDVRQIKNVTDLLLFKKFMRSCAARSGQLLNLSSLSEDLGIAVNTVKAWISLLVASYIIFLVEPYYEKYGKRLVKTPKLYFADTGIACSLLELRGVDDLAHSYLRGSLVETCIMSDLYKQFLNEDKSPALYFWRDQTGHELDVIIDKKPHPFALEIKSGKTISSHYFDNILFWNKITSASYSHNNYVVYGGSETQKWPHATVLSWQDSGMLIPSIFERKAF